jgi:hypothetical protein
VILVLFVVVEKDFDEKPRHPFGLQQASFFEGGGGDEVSAFTSHTTIRDGHRHLRG